MKHLFFFIFLIISFAPKAQELAPVLNFSPNEYSAGNQNWMISQAVDGNIYVANSMGLLEFTGAHWNLYPVPNNTIVRAVKVVGDKIFTGAYMEAGYWQKNRFGNLEYTSILDKFPGPVNDGEQFWHIENIGEVIVIQSFDAIYLYNLGTDEIAVLDTPAGKPISNLFKVEGTIFFFVPEEGLYRIADAKAQLEIPEELLDDSEIILISQSPTGIELVTRAGNFFNWNGTELEKRYSDLSEKLSGISLFSALVLRDNSFLLGSVENGLYQINREGEILLHYNQEKGLQNNTVLSLYRDQDHNVWAGLDNGLSVLNLDSPFRLFQDNIGKIGTVYTSYQTEDYLYLGTNQGLYYKQNSEEEFQFISGTNGQVWSLQEMDGLLFCGHNNGTFLINGSEASKISSRLGTWVVKKYLPQENIYVQGHYNGISFLKREGDEIVDLPMLPDFPHSSKHIVSEEDGDLWVGNEHKGVFRFRLSDSLGDIEQIKNYSFKNSIGITSSIFKFRDSLYYATRNSIFQYVEAEDEFSKDNKLDNLLSSVNRISGRIICQNNKIWGFAENSVFSVSASQLSKNYALNEVFIPKELRTIPQGYENITHLREDLYLLGLVDGYLIFDEDIKKPYEDREIRIERVTRSTLEEDSLFVALDADDEFHYKSNNIKLRYSIPEYNRFIVPVYSYRLRGLTDRWSSWSSGSTASFKNLPYGSYEFEVRGKIGNNIIPATAFAFEIARPWYFSNLAILVYILIFLGLIYLVHQLYKRQHKKRIRENEKALKMKNLEAEQEIIKLQNDQLEKEMAGKNKELAVSTMSLIKKNEFLSSIKQKLKESEASPQVKTVIRTIEKDISEEDNWKFFKEAFNNADKDFFKKIKSKHPDLTSNDLKLCAYLRLNLTSKEIAPLLNISVKSVEIKRYRLRKKMNLPHEESLVDHILAI